MLLISDETYMTSIMSFDLTVEDNSRGGTSNQGCKQVKIIQPQNKSDSSVPDKALERASTFMLGRRLKIS